MAKINLADKIEKQLPVELNDFMRQAGKLAASRGENLYLVGGVIRDLLLKKANLDLDLVVEGDAVTLARQLLPDEPAKITVHRRFSTAKIGWRKWTIDLATARRESYARPGALPSVTPSTIGNDLGRRDFTINAMAIALNPDGYGELVDPHNGRRDIEHRLIRILHDKSFIDDATRIWRGLRYEQRLGFRLEVSTFKLLKRDIAMLNSISGDRIRYELECILNEERPEKVLGRAQELGVLESLHPSLGGNGWLEEKFSQARKLTSPEPPSIALYLALLTYHLTGEEREQLISKLRPTKLVTKTLRDTADIKGQLKPLADAKIKPSQIYHRLYGCSPAAITANLLASDLPIAQKHLKLFLDKLRSIRPSLNGDDLKGIGIAPGPRIKEILNLLLEARLDGQVTTREEEERLVKGWLD